MTLATIRPTGTAEVNLLGDRNNAHAALAPIGDQIDAVLKSTRDSVEFPDDDRLDRAVEYRCFHLFESDTVDSLSRFFVLEPGHPGWGNPVGSEPPRDFGLLAVGLLSPG